MGVFTECSVLVELKTLPFKEKSIWKAAITQNGGTICFVVNKQVRGHDCPCTSGSSPVSSPVGRLCPPFIPTVLSDPDQRHVQPEPQQAAQHPEAPDAGGGGGLHLQLLGERHSPPRGWIQAGRFPRPCAHHEKSQCVL